MFAIGQRVRSFDFPGMSDDCFIEGVVVGVQVETIDIGVEVDMWEGESLTGDKSRVGGEVRACTVPHFITKRVGVVGV